MSVVSTGLGEWMHNTSPHTHIRIHTHTHTHTHTTHIHTQHTHTHSTQTCTHTQHTNTHTTPRQKKLVTHHLAGLKRSCHEIRSVGH